MREVLLDISGVSAGYDGRAVIHGVSVQLREGEIVALVGANGAGKSSLAKTLSGLLPALEGRIRFAGEDITTMTPAERVRLGLIHVPEGRRIFAGLSVEQNLRLGAYAVHCTGAALEARLEAQYSQFPLLRQRAKSPAGNLSGGQQQMLAIARAMMGSPKLLVLDEPSLGLAPLLVDEIFDLVTQLREQGISILLSEQNARRSLMIADRGYVVENGRIVAAADATALLDSADIASRYLGTAPEGAGTVPRDDSYRRLTLAIAQAMEPFHAETLEG